MRTAYWQQSGKITKNLITKYCDTKEYLKSLNLPDARLKFGIRANMTRTVQMNYKGEPRFMQNGWKCNDCLLPDTQEHIIRCPSYQHLRTGKVLASDKHLVEYFRKIIQIRDKQDEKNKWLTLGRTRPAPAHGFMVPIQTFKCFVSL